MPKTNEMSVNVNNSSVQTPFANETAVVLNKESNEVTIRAYFEGILKLSQSANNFPVNLDDVWMLAYPRKDHAVRSLKENFINDIDYQVIPKNGENPKGGRPTNEYMLSTSCLEYFIARKVRPVFEVYRQVFHKAVQKPPMQETLSKYDKMLAESLSQTQEGLRQIEKLHEQLWEEKARVEIMSEEKAKEAEAKNLMAAFLIEMKLYGKFQKFKAEKQLKDTVKRLKEEQRKKDIRPYELPF